MADQPLNSDIKIRRNIRSYRQNLRQESVAAITKRLRPQVMSIPGEEVLVGVLTRDTDVVDLSSYMGEARFGATRGFPIVVGAFGAVSLANAQANIPNVDFGFSIGKDTFLVPTDAALADSDLHQDARDLVADA